MWTVGLTVEIRHSLGEPLESAGGKLIALLLGNVYPNSVFFNRLIRRFPCVHELLARDREDSLGPLFISCEFESKMAVALSTMRTLGRQNTPTLQAMKILVSEFLRKSQPKTTLHFCPILICL